MSTARISEAVSLLAKFNPAQLIQLQQTLPAEIHPLLTPGGLAGPVPATLLAKAAVQLTALGEIQARMLKAIPQAEQRLKWSRRVRLIGDVAAVLGSSSVLAGSAAGGVAAGGSTVAGSTTLIGGIVALAGALAGVFSDYVTRMPDGGSLFETYRGLCEARYGAQMLKGEIDSLLADKINDTSVPLSAAIDKADALCRDILRSFAQTLQGAL